MRTIRVKHEQIIIKAKVIERSEMKKHGKSYSFVTIANQIKLHEIEADSPYVHVNENWRQEMREKYDKFKRQNPIK